MDESTKISRYYHWEERKIAARMNRELFKERLKMCLDKRVGKNGKTHCSPRYHATVLEIHRTSMMRYMNPKNPTLPSAEMIFILIDYIKCFMPNFNPAFLFDQDSKMTFDE